MNLCKTSHCLLSVVFLLYPCITQAGPVQVDMDTSGIAQNVRLEPSFGLQNNFEEEPTSVKPSFKVKNDRSTNRTATVKFGMYDDQGGFLGTCLVTINTGSLATEWSGAFASYSTKSFWEGQNLYTCDSPNENGIPGHFALNTALIADGALSLACVMLGRTMYYVVARNGGVDKKKIEFESNIKNAYVLARWKEIAHEMILMAYKYVMTQYTDSMIKKILTKEQKQIILEFKKKYTNHVDQVNNINKKIDEFKELISLEHDHFKEELNNINMKEIKETALRFLNKKMVQNLYNKLIPEGTLRITNINSSFPNKKKELVIPLLQNIANLEKIGKEIKIEIHETEEIQVEKIKIEKTNLLFPEKYPKNFLDLFTKKKNEIEEKFKSSIKVLEKKLKKKEEEKKSILNETKKTIEKTENTIKQMINKAVISDIMKKLSLKFKEFRTNMKFSSKELKEFLNNELLSFAKKIPTDIPEERYDLIFDFSNQLIDEGIFKEESEIFVQNQSSDTKKITNTSNSQLWGTGIFDSNVEENSHDDSLIEGITEGPKMKRESTKRENIENIKNNNPIEKSIIKYNEFIEKYEEFKFHQERSALGFTVLPALMFSITFFLLWYAHDVAESPHVTVTAHPVPGEDNALKYVGTPTGSVGLNIDSVMFQGPSGWVHLVSQDSEAPEPGTLPILPGSPTSVETCYDETNRITMLAVGTTNGTALVQVNDAGNVVGQSQTLFQDFYTHVTATWYDPNQKKCGASIMVQQEQDGILRWNDYGFKNTAQSLSLKTTENDLVLVTNNVADKFDNFFYTDKTHPHVLVLRKGDVEGQPSKLVDAGIPPETLLAKPLIALPNGHMLAFTTDKNVFYSGESGLFSAVPKEVIGNKEYNNVEIIQNLTSDKTEPQSFKIIFYVDDISSTPVKGSRVLTIPMDRNKERLENFEAQDLFSNKYVLGYNDKSSLVTTAQEMKSNIKDESSAVKPNFSEMSVHYLSPQTLATSEVTSAARSSEEGSPFVFFALKEKGILRVDTKTDKAKTLFGKNIYKKVVPLFQSKQMLFVEDEKLQITDAQGNQVENKNAFSFSGSKIQNILLFCDKNDDEEIIVGTNNGLYILTPQKNLPLYQMTYHLFEGQNITQLGVDPSNAFVFKSDDTSPQGLKATVDLSELDFQNAELMFESGF